MTAPAGPGANVVLSLLLGLWLGLGVVGVAAATVAAPPRDGDPQALFLGVLVPEIFTVEIP